MQIGVLAVQGAFIEHKKMIEELGANCTLLRSKKDLAHLDGLILPGGESTVQGRLLERLDMMEELRRLILDGLPTLATCAGLILLAEHIENDPASYLATLPVSVVRNAYGRQLGSFSTTAPLKGFGTVPMTFIRAPYIKSASKEVEVLSTVDERIVAVSYQNQMALSFHPELGSDVRIHKAFLEGIAKA